MSALLPASERKLGSESYTGWNWVAHPDGGAFEGRDKLEVLGGIVDAEASYSYDDWALCRLGDDYYLFSTSGCSCPSPAETWRIEAGPATLAAIRTKIQSGEYEGYTVPKRQMDEFMALLDEAEAEAKTGGAA